MNINSDFGTRVAVHFEQIPWVPSPMPGVERRMLDRIGDEVARATSIVRYAPGSSFAAHTHTGGEEFLVLEGVFQDEHGDFPVGTYVRNPPTSSHSPRADLGATIFVMLWQFDPQDRTQLRIDTTTQKSQTVGIGVSEIPLFNDARERVRIELWDASANIHIPDHKGMEVLVIEGSFTEGDEVFSKNAWLRLPPGRALTATAGAQGARLWVKSDHLAETPIIHSAG